jgi:hypothetical protein
MRIRLDNARKLIDALHDALALGVVNLADLSRW